MKLFKNAPLAVLSVLLASSTAISSHAACPNCNQSQAAQTTVKRSIFSGTNPRITVRKELFPTSPTIRKGFASGPIFGDNDCSRINGPLFGDNTCVTHKCGGAMFGPQTCAKPDLPCEGCQKEPEPAPRQAYIQNYKTIPSDTIYERLHKCSDLAPFQLEWVDFRLQDGQSESYSRKLGNYRFRLFGCRRFSKKAMLNEGRIIQKNMQFIDIFEDLVRDCYNIVKVPNDLCLRDQDYEAPEYILTAEITDYFMNVCDGYDWDNAQKNDKRTGSAEMTVTWRLLDLTKTKVLWKGETTGYSELEEGTYNGEIDLIERAFADASLNLKGLPEFEEQLAQRVDPNTLEQQKTSLLALEQAMDPVKCKVEIPQASICPIPTTDPTAGDTISVSSYVDGNGMQPQQCPMQAEILEYEPQPDLLIEDDIIPLEMGQNQTLYTENGGSICYGYNNEDQYADFNAYSIEGGNGSNGIAYPLEPAGVCEKTLNNFIEPEENACENSLFAQPEQKCNPALVSFVNTDPECKERPIDKWLADQEVKPEICLFANTVETHGGISKDNGFYLPEVEEVTSNEQIKKPQDWQPYTEATQQREPEIIAEDILPPCPDDVVEPVVEEVVQPNGTVVKKPSCKVKEDDLPPCSDDVSEPVVEEIVQPNGTVVKKPSCKVKEKLILQPQTQPEIIEKGNYRTYSHFCIENIAPYPDMRPENLYRVRASMMSVRNAQNKESAGLLIADDLILTSADLVDENVNTYEVETINGVKNTAKVTRINVKKNIALLQTERKMYFRPLSLNMELPPVGRGGFMSLGLLNNAEGENYLDDKGTIKGYRFSEQMGTEIITDTFVQTVSSGGALIDEKGVVTGLASRNQNFDNSGDLFLPIQDAINSVGLEVCGQTEPFTQAPMAVVKPVSTAIDNYKGSKEPAIMAKGKRK